MAFSGKADQIN